MNLLLLSCLGLRRGKRCFVSLVWFKSDEDQIYESNEWGGSALALGGSQIDVTDIWCDVKPFLMDHADRDHAQARDKYTCNFEKDIF
jgi:hypothetical protein